MPPHEFIFKPGIWIGEGKITFSASPDEVKFYTRWNSQPESDEAILTAQEVELHGMEDKVTNNFELTDITSEHFLLRLENELVGQAHGKGVVDEHTIAWEIKGSDNFEGYEVYEKQENGEYIFHAEYTSDDQFRTIIDGRVWKKLGQD